MAPYTARQHRHRFPVLRAGYDDLSLSVGAIGLILALVPITAMLGLALGLVAGVCAIAAHEQRRDELDHPARMWLGSGLSVLAVAIGLLQAFNATVGMLDALHH
jgi:hypothetical protein